ncbi:MAG: hypothetical protein SPL35_05365 [Bacteroidales bacterium]|nr:hypothetical protein [Bacteroidales bacterium]
MKTKNIFKTLILAAVLVSACGKNEIADDFKGYTLPVTVNVARQGDEPATRASYNETSKKLEFTAGDKLLVSGTDSKAGDFAGLLAWQSEGTFSGTIMTEKEYEGTAEELLSSATDDAEALLIPAGYKSYEYFDLDDEITPTAGYYQDKTNAFALTKAAAVEQFSFELAETYSSGFTLSPQNAIVSFTISGLTANKEVAVSFDTFMCGVISKSVTTSAEGVATFAIGLDADIPLENCTLTVDGNIIAMPTKMTEAGHIYNISRNAKVVIWNSSKVAGIDINENPGDNSFESDGITVAAYGENSANFMDSKMSFDGSDGYFTFTSSVGNIKKTEINYTGDVFGYEEEPVGWSLGVGTFTWEGDPATSVTLPSSGYASIEGITSIVFTLE